MDKSELLLEHDYDDFYSYLTRKGHALALGDVDDFYQTVRYDFLGANFHPNPEIRSSFVEKIKSAYKGILSLEQSGDSYVMIRIKTKDSHLVLPLCELPRGLEDHFVLSTDAPIQTLDSAASPCEEEMQGDTSYWVNYGDK